MPPPKTTSGETHDSSLGPPSSGPPSGGTPPTLDDAVRAVSRPGESLPEIPGYEILAELGRGGMGVVYKAKQIGLDRIVALKMVLAGAHASANDLARFRTEAEAAAHLQHDNIVKVFEVGQHAGLPFFTLEYVDGGSLADVVRGSPQPFLHAAELLESLARGAHYAHTRGIVHRDLKPANVLLTSHGTPKIADFGLARRLDGSGAPTRTGAVLGTPGYMAPEQALGKRSDVGPACDTYALGAMLYEALTGRPPFQGESPLEALHQTTSLEPVSPAWFRPGIPRDLETICLVCLRKEPAKRYPSAQALAEDLARFRAHLPIMARRTPYWERAWKWARRRPVPALLLAFAALVFLALVAGAAWYMEHERRQVKTERKLRDQARDQERAARQALYESQMKLAWEAWQRADVERVLDILNKQRPDSDEQDFRGPDWHYLWRLCHSELFVLPAHNGTVFGTSFSLNGRIFATAGADGTVGLWDIFSQEELHRLHVGIENVRFAALSPDGNLLAAAGADPAVQIWDVAAAEKRCVLKGHTMTVMGGAFSPDGKTLATVGRDATVRLWDVAGARQLREWTSERGKISRDWFNCVAFSPDGKSLAIGTWEKLIHILDAGTLEPLHNLEGHDGSVWSVAFSPDGKTLVSGCFDMTVRIWDPSSGAKLATLVGHTDGVWCVAVSSDSRSIASASYDGTVKLWDAATLQARATLRGHTHQVRSVVFHPDVDSHLLVSAGLDGKVRGWDATTGQAREAIRADNDMIRGLAVSLDGKRVVTGSREGVIRLWDFASGKLLAQAEGHSSDVICFAFSPDGKTLASGSQDRHILFWRLEDSTLTLTGELQYEHSQITALAFAPDGNTLASASESGHIKLWALQGKGHSGTCKAHSARVTCLVYTPDGSTLISCSRDDTVRLWDAESLERKSTLEGHTREVMWLALTSDGKTLASAGYDTDIKLWDLASGKEQATLKGHTAPVWSVAFGRDGKTLISAGGSRERAGEVKIWDLVERREIIELQGHATLVTALALTEDGKGFATVDARGILKLWDLDAELARKAAGARRRED